MNPVGVLLVFLFFLIYIGIIVVMIISIWKIFTKANQPGWACLVPFYNWYIMVLIAKKPMLYFGMMFVPFVNIVFMIMIINGICKNFGKTEGFTVGMIFLPFIFYPILGLGSAKYVDQKDNNKDLLDTI